jgi:hypothetical protein
MVMNLIYMLALLWQVVPRANYLSHKLRKYMDTESPKHNITSAWINIHIYCTVCVCTRGVFELLEKSSSSPSSNFFSKFANCSRHCLHGSKPTFNFHLKKLEKKVPEKLIKQI